MRRPRLPFDPFSAEPPTVSALESACPPLPPGSADLRARDSIRAVGGIAPAEGAAVASGARVTGRAVVMNLTVDVRRRAFRMTWM